MVCSRCNVKVRLRLSAPARAPDVNRGDQGDVREVSASAEWIVEHGDVAGMKLQVVHGRLHRHGHGAEVHRHVIAHCDNLAAGIKYRARIISTFLNVGGKSGSPQGCSHFFRNGVVEILENLEFDGIAQDVSSL